MTKDKAKKEKRVFSTRSKRIVIIVAVVLLVTFILSASTGAAFYYQYGVKPKITNSEAKNIIIMIGDGMGFNHLEATIKYRRGDELAMNSLDIHGKIRTRSLDMWPTDSAAAGTAIATGKKVRNGHIGMSATKSYKNIFEYAKAYNKKVGFVTTVDACDATIAAFSSHVKKRNMHEDIIKQQIASNIDLIIGTGRTKYDPYENTINTTDRVYCKTIEELKLVDSDKRIFAILDDNAIKQIGENSLNVLVDQARRNLENENGFVLLVEGGRIDKYSHSNELIKVVEEVKSFDDAVSRMHTYAKDNPDTFLFVTADHETGNLKIPNNANDKNMSNTWFKSKRHTSYDVPYFLMGPGSEEVGQVKKPLDNTDVFNICKQLLDNYHKAKAA